MSKKKRLHDTIEEDCDNENGKPEMKYIKIQNEGSLIDKIPNEIMLEIICLVPPNTYDKIAPTALVCKKWNTLWNEEKSKRARLWHFFKRTRKITTNMPYGLIVTDHTIPLLFVIDSLRCGTSKGFTKKEPYQGGRFVTYDLINPNENAEIKLSEMTFDVTMFDPKRTKQYSVKELWNNFLKINQHKSCIFWRHCYSIINIIITNKVPIDKDDYVHSFDVLPYLDGVDIPLNGNYRDKSFSFSGLVGIVESLLEWYVKNPSKYPEFEQSMRMFQDELVFC